MEALEPCLRFGSPLATAAHNSYRRNAARTRNRAPLLIFPTISPRAPQEAACKEAQREVAQFCLPKTACRFSPHPEAMNALFSPRTSWAILKLCEPSRRSNRPGGFGEFRFLESSLPHRARRTKPTPRPPPDDPLHAPRIRTLQESL